jgi:hypothetical protein
MVMMDDIHGRVWVRQVVVRRVVVRNLMRYVTRRWCNHWTVCKWSCARMSVVSSRVFEMSLSRGSVGRVRKEVRLVIVDV